MRITTTLLISIVSVASIIVSVAAPIPTALAQSAEPGSGQALEIGPPLINLSADPGETVTANISLRDISTTSLFVTGTFNDFVAGGEDGTPKILLEEDEVSPYSMKAWVEPITPLTLESREIKNLVLTINVPADAAPGGYYGVVRFTGTPPDLEGAGVSLAASLGSLVLLKVSGDAKESLAIEEFSVNKSGITGTIFEAAPLNFVERIKNDGNIHQQPSGLVTIKDMFGNVVATLGVNQPPRDVLPGSTRKFEQPLDQTVIGDKVLFGYYTAELNINYGDGESATSSTSFWVIPYTWIGIGILVLVGGFLGIRFLIKRYNNHIIKKATGSRRK